jgi:predicted CDP-diglyceride synthetase/phosphatidate cytidylyltransferase
VISPAELHIAGDVSLKEVIIDSWWSVFIMVVVFLWVLSFFRLIVLNVVSFMLLLQYFTPRATLIKTKKQPELFRLFHYYNI